MLKSEINGCIQRCPLHFLFDILEVLAKAVRQEKEVKSIQIRKEEVKLPLFAGDIIYINEDFKGSIKKLSELTIKLAGYKANIQRCNLLHFCVPPNLKQG